jgi:hypothetical protein
MIKNVVSPVSTTVASAAQAIPGISSSKKVRIKTNFLVLIGVTPNGKISIQTKILSSGTGANS